MEVQEIKEQLKEIFRTVINNDKWITIHPNGEDGKGRHLLLKDGETPKEAIDRTYGKGEKSDTKDDGDKAKRREIEHKGARIDINPDGKYSDIKIDAPEGKTFKNGDTWYRTQALTEKAEELAKKIIDEEFGKFDTKDGSKDISKEEHAKIKEQVSKMSDDELVKAHFESQKGYESETPRAGSMTKHEATYGEVAQELKRRTGRGFSAASTESEIKEALSKAKSDSKGEKKYNYTLTKREVESNKMLGGMADTGNYYTNGEFAIDKKYLNIKGQEPTKKEEIEKSLKHILKGDSTYRYTPVKDFEIGELKREYGKPIKVAKYSYYDEKYGYERNIYLNKKYNDLFKNFDLKFGGETEPVFAYKGKDIVGVVMPINAREQSYSKTVNNEIEEELTEDKNQLKLKIDNSKEQDMALLEEIKKLITKVENNKENEMEIENAKVDKRDIIRQIMAIAGKEEASEDVKTIAKLAEKLAYDKSEAGTADNEMDKEDPDDEKEVKEVKEEVKEDVENKCKNSVDNSKTDYFAEMNKIYNAAQEAKKENIYISQAQREQDAVDYFKK